MGAGTIYMVGADGHLTRMRPGAPVNEDHMQALVARHPELIGDADGELLLVRREQPVGDGLDVAGRWSLDHLFVTRSAIPVLVELKRAVDTRLRREVVGQMLDYAANGVAHWPPGMIADAFASTCQASGMDQAAALAEFLGDGDPADFWNQVDANLQAGRIKLVFVADVIPRELARIVEFLNEQMRADVRAVELRWYEGEDGNTTLVPRVFGETERAIVRKSATRAAFETIGTEEWIARNVADRGETAVRRATELIEMIGELGGKVGAQKGSLYGTVQTQAGKSIIVAYFLSNGRIQLAFGNLVRRSALVEESARKAHYDEFTKVLGPLSTSKLNGFPGFEAAALDAQENRAAFMTVARRLVDAAIVE